MQPNYVNKVELQGIVGNIKVDIVSGIKIATISMITNHCYKDKNGAGVIESTWHLIKAVDSESVHFDDVIKGDWIYLTGRIRTRSISSGTSQTTLSEIVADNLINIQSVS